MPYKTNLHFHVKGDLMHNISYSPFEAIDYARSKGFSVLAFTCHKTCIHKPEYAQYARQKGMLLIPGIEARIEGKDVVILNCDSSIDDVHDFPALREYKKAHSDIFILAPHPYLTDPTVRASLQKRLERHIDLFDAIELTVFSNHIFNFNKKAMAAAKKYGKPLIATSDAHYLSDLEQGYALIDAGALTIEAVLAAIRAGKFTNVSKPLSCAQMLRFRAKNFLALLKK
jgi:predicted metal-dependent phosphoesterase TrpH